MSSDINNLDAGYTEWNVLIEDEKQKFGLCTEKDIFSHFSIPSSTLNSIRTRDNPIGSVNAIKILSKVNRPLTFQMMLATTRREHFEAINYSQKYNKKGTNNKDLYESLIVDEGNTFNWAKALEIIYDRHACESDKYLTDLLGITAAALSQYRKGKRGLSTTAKTFIFFRLGIELNENSIIFCLSDELIEATQKKEISFVWVNDSLLKKM